MNNTVVSTFISFFGLICFCVGLLMGGYLYPDKPHQICVITAQPGETIVPDNVKKSDCTLFLGDK